MVDGNVRRGERTGRNRASARTFPASRCAARPGPRNWPRTTLLKGTAYGPTHKDNAWFVGFAPRDNPEIVVAALFENGEHGQLAAPIVRDVHQGVLRQESPARPSRSRRSRTFPPACSNRLRRCPPPPASAAASVNP